MIKEIDIKKLRKTAENYYANGEFYCSEAILKTLKDEFNAPFGDDIIKLSSGFPIGMGSGCTCGAVNGAVMAIGMYFGRDTARSPKVKKAMALTKELQEQFTAKRKVCCCKVLTKGMDLGTPVHLKHCVEITGEVAELAGIIIARELGYKIK
ncbi:C-GCAxxG-C-C family (seleno)protein [uncultured Cetobacterium sp.]|uniref:C-GCAxxG-C-C family (seleno)protein n=1 Tax=uncultured Cetobacterium sp. TaxID=527638 RepID=UPI00261675D4|nr:C-GCAxxG-C-C family (seleno)protein [uncultured Cetobacterium sp.]